MDLVTKIFQSGYQLETNITTEHEVYSHIRDIAILKWTNDNYLKKPEKKLHKYRIEHEIIPFAVATNKLESLKKYVTNEFYKTRKVYKWFFKYRPHEETRRKKISKKAFIGKLTWIMTDRLLDSCDGMIANYCRSAIHKYVGLITLETGFDRYSDYIDIIVPEEKLIERDKEIDKHRL